MGVPVLLVGTLPGAVIAVVDSDFTIVLHAELSSVVVAPDGVADKEPFAVGKSTHFDCVEGVVKVLVKSSEMRMMVLEFWRRIAALLYLSEDLSPVFQQPIPVERVREAVRFDVCFDLSHNHSSV